MKLPKRKAKAKKESEDAMSFYVASVLGIYLVAVSGPILVKAILFVGCSIYLLFGKSLLGLIWKDRRQLEELQTLVEEALHR